MLCKTIEVLEMCHKGLASTSEAIRDAADSVYSYLVFRMKGEHVDIPPELQSRMKQLARL